MEEAITNNNFEKGNYYNGPYVFCLRSQHLLAFPTRDRLCVFSSYYNL